MRKKIIDKLMTIVMKEKDLDKDRYEQIEYGLTAMYILITKSIIIFSIALVLGIFKEMLIFLLLFNGIRLFAFGLHATKSYICLIVSIFLFLGLPFVATKIIIPQTIKLLLGFIVTVIIFKYSPADTQKRPIVSKKRRLFFKISSTIVSITYVIISIFTSSFISNCLLFSLLLESIFIMPITYKLFKLPYNNYLVYLGKEDLNVS